jgi:hypothetical protein
MEGYGRCVTGGTVGHWPEGDVDEHWTAVSGPECGAAISRMKHCAATCWTSFCAKVNGIISLLILACMFILLWGD